MQKIALSIFLFFYIFYNAQSHNTSLIHRADSLLIAARCNEAIQLLEPFVNEKIARENVPIQMRFFWALEICNHNKAALNGSVRLLDSGILNKNEKAEQYLLNARLYEKMENEALTKSSLSNCKKQFTNKTPEEIIQKWNVRMSSYHRVLTKKKDSALFYAREALNYNSGEIASAYFLNAMLYDDFKISKDFYCKAINYYEDIGNAPGLGAMYLNLADLYKENKHYDKYKKMLFKGVKVLNSPQSTYEDKILYYKDLKKFYENQKNYKMTIAYMDSTYIAQNKIDSVYDVTSISLIEKKFENNKLKSKIYNIHQFLKEKEKTETAIKKKNQFLILLIIFFIITTIIVIKLSVSINVKRKKLLFKSSLLNQRNSELRQLSDYNKILMKESNHRVKNNLAMLAGIIKIKKSKTTDPKLSEKLSEIEGRIQSISSIHKHIYQFDNYSKLDPKLIIEDIINNQRDITNSALINNIEMQIDSFQLDISKLLPLTLIINELITNSIKYALRTKKDTIKIELKQQQSQVSLWVRDSGEGFNLSETNKESTGIGLYLIKILTKQLQGDLLSHKTDNYFCINLKFNI